MFERMIERGFETREKNGQKTLVGYAAVFYNGKPDTEYRVRDFMVERFRRGAFSRTLAEAKIDVKAKRNHSILLGRQGNGTLRLEEDRVGLRYEIDLPKTTFAEDLLEEVRRNDIIGSSLAFDVDMAGEEFERQADGPPIRWLTDVDVYDVGPVDEPAYKGTSVSARSEEEAEILRLKKRLAAVKYLELRGDL